jgi:hypothetical protein
MFAAGASHGCPTTSDIFILNHISAERRQRQDSNRYYNLLYNYLILKLFYEIRSRAVEDKIFLIHNNIYLDKLGEVA